MNVQNETLLNNVPGDPNGYVTKDGMWAAVPWGKKFVILHNGQQIHTTNNYRSAMSYIKKAMKGKSISTLDKFL